MHGGFRLSDAHRFDEDDVESRGLAQHDRLASLSGHSAERSRRGRGPHEDRRVVADALHAGFVAENRAAAALRRRVYGQHRQLVAQPRDHVADGLDEGRLACPGDARDADAHRFPGVRQAALDEVYLDVAQESEENMLPYLEEMESMGLTVHFRLPVLDRIEKACCDETSAVRISRELSRCAGGNVVTMGTVELKLRDQVLKRTMDIVGGIVGCIISIPIIALVAIPLKLESPGPLIFKQRRVGRNGRVFYIHKLRSMYVDAEARKKELMAQNEMNGLMFKMEDDPRITRVGRFIRRTSIDELPQFFDVVRGSMSLVGTRPPTLDEYRQYESHHKRRLSMKPGITGLWQVSGRSDIDDFEEVVKLEVQYIDNWSIWMDIYLLFRTVGVVFDRKGAK